MFGNGKRFAQLRQVASDDLDELAELIAAADSERGVELHQQACEALAVARTVDDLRYVGELADRARTAVTGEGSVMPCLFNPGHGPSVRRVVFAPSGGKLEYVPACEACAEEIDAGRVPPIRMKEIDGRMQPYWRASLNAGHFGHSGAAGELDRVHGADLPAGAFGAPDWAPDIAMPGGDERF